MITKQHTLASGRTVTLTMPNLFELAATDVDIPNQALTDIVDLVVYGAMVSGTGNDKKRLDENKRFLRSQFQLAALCITEPKLILMGEATDGNLAPTDLVPRDLRDIAEFFQTGGSRSVPATPDYELGQGTQTDPPGAAMGQDAGGTDRA